MGNAAGYAGDGNPEWPELALEPECGGFTVHAGRSRDDDLGDPVLANAVNQARDGQIVGTNALEGREEPPEDEIAAPHRPGALDGHQIMHASDDAEHLLVALRIGAHGAQSALPRELGHVAAALAGPELVAEGGQLGAERSGESVVGGEQPQNIAVRSLLTAAGEARQVLDQAANLVAQTTPGILTPPVTLFSSASSSLSACSSP